MNNSTDKTVLVTGGADGIGLGLASKFGKEGCKIMIVDINQEQANIAKSSLESLGVQTMIHVGDVEEIETSKSSISKLIDSWGKIDILINNVGIAGIAGKIWEQPIEEMDRAYNVNLRSTFLFCKYAIPHMLEKKYGRIINISSISGKEGNPGMVPYSSTKAAIIGLTKSLGKELATSGITVNCITPAVVETKLLSQITQEQVDYMVNKIPMGRTAKIEELAELVWWIASDECSFTTAATFDISGGRATY